MPEIVDLIHFTNRIFVNGGEITVVNYVVADAKQCALDIDSILHYDHLGYAIIDVSVTNETGNAVYIKRQFENALQTIWRRHPQVTIGNPPSRR